MSEAFLPLAPLFGPEPCLSPETAARIEAQLWAILKRQARTYSPGSGSLRVETARELYTSACFTVRLALNRLPRPLNEQTLDAEALFCEGKRLLDACVRKAKMLYCAAIDCAPNVPHAAHNDAILEIGRFFHAYRPDLMAHEIPCVIDYPLCVPVDDLQGVEYILAFLRHLIAEDRFLSRFQPETIARLIRALCPDGEEAVFNLFEPVAANALALSALKNDPRTLDIAPADRVALARIMEGAGRDGLRALFRTAEEGLLATLCIADLGIRDTLRYAADGLCARLLADPSTAPDGAFASLAP